VAYVKGKDNDAWFKGYFKIHRHRCTFAAS
jgi:hypothetical protein